MRFSAAVLLVVLPSLSAWARIHHNDAWARQQFATAERMREALNGRPADDRTRREYQRVIDSYRRVYFGAPASSKADPSVVATAELLVEMGRQFDDNKILRSAIAQYRFLRKEYPGSKYRFDALFTMGEVYKDDLGDPEEARATFEDFLHRYPRNHLADDARSALKELDTDAEEMEQAARKPASKSRSSDKSAAADSSADRRSKLPRVTGVRHWSASDYTRVAIDVEKDVKFESQRIAHPDRIFFDLRDTKLASTLVGKTFEVDDGFLKKIRVAEFQPGRTRIVLEVDDLASYDAFLLPNPYRLIIDVHGKESRAALRAKSHRAADISPAAEADSSTVDDSSGQPSERNLEPAGDAEVQKPAKAAVKFSKAAPVKDETASEFPDAPPTAASVAQPASGIGVVKTTVPVPGTDRKIPKTIVEAEDQAPTTVATLQPDKLRPEVTSAQRAAITSKTGSRAANGKKSRSNAVDTADLETREARPMAAGDRSLIRALGLKIGKIVIDAGHGGHDTGTIGPNGLLEKDLVLDVAKRLGRLLEARLGAEVVYTRQDDTFIPLETRTAIANRERADLFISVHANSSHDSDARGVETYYLNFTSSPEALEVAARENAVSEKSIHELQDLVKKIALKEKIDESREFATDVQESLYGGLSLRNAGVRNRGIKKAPFIVLIGANMPSILAEISFVSNPSDERKLQTAEHRQKIAESLYRGVSKYAGGLSGVKVASKGLKNEGQ
ncbi:MAG: N-acetylmuramoyl-L-alanine amidase [Acidobacteria bacterium]|nr:MAG: N-acetylmuramoyl-L-alanine amidase [Acidobacteriota bacterium]